VPNAKFYSAGENLHTCTHIHTQKEVKEKGADFQNPIGGGRRGRINLSKCSMQFTRIIAFPLV